MTLETFTSCMSILQGIFGQLEDTKVKIYHTVLSHMPDADFEIATKRLIKTFKPTSTVQFPVPANFSEAVGDTPTIKAQEYLSRLQKAVYSVGSYRSVDFGSPALHSVIDRFGGWGLICQWGQKEWDINESRFLKALEVAIEYGDVGPAYLKGTIEATNGNLKYAQLTHVCRDINGKIFLGSGLHPQTKLIEQKEDNSANVLISDIANKMSF